MFRLTVIALVCFFPLNTGKNVSVGHCNHDIDTIIKTVFRKAKAVTVTLDSDDLITLATARTGKPGHFPRAVYFSAYLNTHQKNMRAGQIIIFKDVVVNRGGGYNPHTGQFVAPMTGDYWFSLDFLTLSGHSVYLQIRINGKEFTSAYGNPKGSHISVTRNVLLPLNKGDIVTVVNSGNGRDIHGAHGRYTGFSGYLMSTY